MKSIPNCDIVSEDLTDLHYLVLSQEASVLQVLEHQIVVNLKRVEAWTVRIELN